MKLIMLDMDGTLFTDDKRITEATVDALLYAKSQGICVGIASGRAKSLLDKTIAEYHLEDIVDYAVAINGVQIVDFKKNFVKETYVLSCENVNEIARRLQDFPSNFVVYDDECRYVKYMSDREVRAANRNGTKLVVYDFEKNTRAWPKVLVISDQEIMSQEEFVYLDSLHTDEYHGFETAPFGYEFVHKNVSKGKGIQMLCDYMGITMDEVMAFGDSGNDVDMLQAVGLGVAMGNANEAAKKAAKDITLSNEEDGVAYYLNRYLNRG